MRSVADDLRADLREQVERLPIGERVELMLELGRRDVATYASANDLSIEDATRRLRAARHIGRRRSVAADLDRL